MAFMGTRPYVGRRLDTGKLERFDAPQHPHEEVLGETYSEVIGPFRTARAARWMVEYPHTTLQTVAEIERAAAADPTFK
jgi:hypothetical protein